MKYLKKYPWINKKFIFFIVITILFIIVLCFTNHKDLNPPMINSNKKIALCFLIYDKINHEQIWYDYLKNIDPNKYNIYIHYKTNKPLKYFEKYKLKNCIETEYARLSIVLAQNLVLKEALKDPLNQHFIWLSGACIPVKSFNYVYNYLDVNNSYFNLMKERKIPYDSINFTNENNITKASMSSILNRKHSEIYVDNNDNIKIWFNEIDKINKNLWEDPNRSISFAIDEIVYLTLINHYNLQNEIKTTYNLGINSIIINQWTENSNSKKYNKSKYHETEPFEYLYICPEELESLIHSDSLFARKFTPECKGLENLNELLNNL